MPRGSAFAPILLALLVTASGLPAQDGFKPIFDGQSLNGWKCPDMSYWSVEDGAITARSTNEHPCKNNQFLVWQLGSLDDFELKLQFKISGHESANAGIQIRSQIHDDGHAVGYQADMDLAGNWVGALYDEHTDRKMLAKRGQQTVLAEDGTRTSTNLPGGDPIAAIRKGEWNEYHISARGSHIELKINGQTTAIVIDRQKGQYDAQGHLALQLHSGPAMTVQYKDIQLKRLKLSDSRKKIVLVAGAPSHGPGDHEFNAGIKLLAQALQPHAAVIAANYHDKGWPVDPTAFDNADAVVLFMDGGANHPVMKHLDEVEALMQKGVGLMCMHYGVEVPAGDGGNAFLKWIGGYYESGWSINPHWTAKSLLNPDHPVTRGVKPFEVNDEWYFNMRWKSDDEKSVVPLLQAVPDDEARSGSTSYPRGPKDHIVKASGRTECLMWAVQRADNGRGVGFTGGHRHHNWGNDDYRKLVLNALLWVAGAEVPDGGFPTPPLSPEMLEQNLDPKGERKKK